MWPQIVFFFLGGGAHGAKSSGFGSQLGLSERATVEWVGHWGMKWPALLPLLLERRKGPPPHVLLLHFGGNNLGLIKGKALIIQAKDDLARLKVAWPGVLIIFSAVLPHKVWWGLGDPHCLDKTRNKVNRK